MTAASPPNQEWSLNEVVQALGRLSKAGFTSSHLYGITEDPKLCAQIVALCEERKVRSDKLSERVVWSSESRQRLIAQLLRDDCIYDEEAAELGEKFARLLDSDTQWSMFLMEIDDLRRQNILGHIWAGGKTVQELAEEFGLSEKRVNQLRYEAYERLQRRAFRPQLQYMRYGREASKAENIRIIHLNLTGRVQEVLRRASIYTVADLLKYSESDLLGITNFGLSALDMVKQAIKMRGFTLRPQ